MKTHGGWQVIWEKATAITTWTAPTGHRYERPSSPADPTVEPRTSSPPPTRAELPDEPPF